VKLKKTIFNALLILQGALIVTGGAVRLTGSGLGCPTWPTCTGSSITPVPNQAQGSLHSWIEFGNRLLTFALVIAALIALVATIRQSKQRVDRRRVRWIAIWQLLGILGQGVLGGITVLTKLNPIPVSGHFLLSIILVAGALSLRHRMLDRPRVVPLPVTRKMVWVVTALSALVVTVGTVVTGSGPHAGDLQAKRYPFSPREISYLHADLVIALICLAIGLLLIIRVSEHGENKTQLTRAIELFLIISLGQGFIGYVQYFTGVPESLVALHLLGATMVWIAAWNLYLLATPLSRKSSRN
jgi:cytochrome c oxidase assembly protein subunit 15